MTTTAAAAGDDASSPAGLRNRENVRKAPSNTTTRRPANNYEDAIKSTNERILDEVHEIYTNKDTGLTQLGRFLGTDVRVPRRKITVMIIGNHSAGKSSFINWYIGESVLKTGVAIETQGFCFVTAGKRRDTLKGLATLTLYPHLKPLLEMDGVLPYLTTEICTSRANKFQMVTFVDTPGLVDGELKYAFNISETYIWLGANVDRVYVFFDPMGQALCKRTLDILEPLWANHSEKMKLFLAKADEAGNEKDRQKVLMQIVQSLCKRTGLNQSGFEMPTIYIPEMVDDNRKAGRCVNQIDEVCKDIERCIEETVQTSLNNLGADVAQMKNHVETLLKENEEKKSRNWNRCIKSNMLSVIGMLIPIFAFVTWIFSTATKESLQKALGSYAEPISGFMEDISSFWNLIPAESHLNFVISVVIASCSCLIFSRFFTCEDTYSSKDSKYLKNSLKKLAEIEKRQAVLYDDYLKQSVGEEEF